MVNGNYILYGDRPSSESEVVEDHVQTRTAERKTKRKPNRTANELQNSLHMAQQLDNDTDSVKYEKKIKEPRLLRYVPTTDVSEHFVTEKFETYDLKPSSEERPKRAVFTKKPKNPSDGSVNYVHSRSSSSCSSPTGNLPTISEHGERYGTYRVRPTKKQQITDIIANNPYESKLEKYFTRPRSLKLSKGSHPDSLYRVPPDAGTGAGKLTRALRVLRWPAALLLVCGALAAFVVFLMPSNMLSGMDTANSTFWETNLMEASIGGRLINAADQQSKTTESAPAKKHGSKTPEIDFYASDSDKELDLTLEDIEKIIEPLNKKLLVAPVFPEHIAPEVQYGNEKADEDNLRSPKILLEISDESTMKPHITQKPERPLAIYFNDITTTSTETITKAETVNDVTAYDEKVTAKNERNIVSSKVARRPYEDTKRSSEPTMPPAVRDYYNHVHLSRPGDIFTSGHSKFFGIGIEDAEKMQSTTQSSLYNTRVSPTLPTWRDRDDSTTKNYPVLSADAPHCRSTSLPLCRGVLPYDLAGSPASVDGKDISTLLPQIEFMVASNCSERVKQFLCSLLEPECSPAPHQPKQPCRNICRAILDTCDGYIPRELSPVFNCRQYPRSQCSGAQVPCNARELPCGDGTCVLRDWMCDGSNDCLDGDDERHCSSCAQSEFNCGVGGCIAQQWVCDGYRDCPGGDDETPRACEERGLPPRADAGEEPAGSAPAPAVRRPLVEINDARKRRTEDDSSKELLMMSDSSNALKINYTRRPSPARLTPYQPKLRTLSNLPFNKNKLKTAENASIPQPAKKQPTSGQNETKAIGNYEYKPKAKMSLSEILKPTSSNEFLDDLVLFDDIAQAELAQQKQAQMRPKGATSRLGTREFPPEGDWPPRTPAPAAPMAAMAAMAAAAPAASKPEDDSPTSHVYTPDTQGPMREFTPAGPPIRGQTLLDKSVNQYVKIIDGAALLRKAAEAAAAEARVAANSTYHFDEDEDLPSNSGGGTAHASPCPSGELRCVDGRCITLAQLCDGTIDCSDHADEDNCFT